MAWCWATWGLENFPGIHVGRRHNMEERYGQGKTHKTQIMNSWNRVTPCSVGEVLLHSAEGAQPVWDPPSVDLPLSTARHYSPPCYSPLHNAFFKCKTHHSRKKPEYAHLCTFLPQIIVGQFSKLCALLDLYGYLASAPSIFSPSMCKSHHGK